MYALSNQEWVEQDNQYHYHLNNGHKCFNNAKKLCSYLPRRSDQEKCTELFRMAVLTIVSLGDWKVVIANLMISLGDYGIAVYDEYKNIENYLLWADYHFEMALFHLDIIMRSGLEPTYYSNHFPDFN